VSDLVLENGPLLDGTGNPWFFGDVGRVHKRGLIAPGYAADLAVFDPEKIVDKATYEDSRHFPAEMSHVLVSGAKAVEYGILLETGEGQVIGRENR
jgi:N-acyl-D-aspartate/D-glutamate deacylase